MLWNCLLDLCSWKCFSSVIKAIDALFNGHHEEVIFISSCFCFLCSPLRHARDISFEAPWLFFLCEYAYVVLLGAFFNIPIKVPISVCLEGLLLVPSVGMFMTCALKPPNYSVLWSMFLKWLQFFKKLWLYNSLKMKFPPSIILSTFLLKETVNSSDLLGSLKSLNSSYACLYVMSAEVCRRCEWKTDMLG